MVVQHDRALVSDAKSDDYVDIESEHEGSQSGLASAALPQDEAPDVQAHFAYTASESEHEEPESGLAAETIPESGPLDILENLTYVDLSAYHKELCLLGR